MLKQFIYLNEQALDEYLSILEDGLRGGVEEKSGKNTNLSGKAGISNLGIGGSRESQEELMISRVDTSPARFERLQKLALGDIELSGWIERGINDDIKDNISAGNLLDIECEVYIPEVVKALSPSGELARTVDQITVLSQLAPSFGSPIEGLPNFDQLQAIKGFAATLGSDAIFVGEMESSNHKVAGKLQDKYIKGDVEGVAHVVGKVVSSWGDTQWKPLLALPGMNLMSREQRRDMERKGPDNGQEGNWLQGPAYMLEILAIYR